MQILLGIFSIDLGGNINGNFVSGSYPQWSKSSEGGSLLDNVYNFDENIKKERLLSVGWSLLGRLCPFPCHPSTLIYISFTRIGN